MILQMLRDGMWPLTSQIFVASRHVATGPKRISLPRGNSVAFGLMRTLDWIL